MNSKLKVFISFIVFVLILIPEAKSQFLADSIFIYSEFRRAGTTAGLHYNHKELENSKAKKTQLNQADLTGFKEIFKDVKQKKFFQQKHGGRICYALVYHNGQKYNYVIESSLEFGRIINLTNMRKLTLEDSINKQKLYQLIRKYWHSEKE